MRAWYFHKSRIIWCLIICSILRHVFHDLMTDCSSAQAKQLRNDFLMICLQVARICPDAPFVVSTQNIVATFQRDFTDNLAVLCCRKQDFLVTSVYLPLSLKVTIDTALSVPPPPRGVRGFRIWDQGVWGFRDEGVNSILLPSPLPQRLVAAPTFRVLPNRSGT